MKLITVFLLTLALLSLPTDALANGETLTPNMSLITPAVGITSGPQWGADIVSTFSILDSHDHSPGKGVPVTPAGLNINSDLSCQQNNLTNPRSVRFFPNASTLTGTSDLGAIYESGVDLYYRDGNGNNVRLTQSGSIVGTAGSITGLSSPASAAYVSANSTFVWQSATSTAANLDAGSVLLRNITANSKAVTLNPPNALAANYSLTLPAALPASTKILSIDLSGNIGDSYDVDNSSLQVSANTLSVKAGGVTQAMLAARASGSTVAAGGVAMSLSSGAFSTTSTTPVAVTNLSVTITTTGRPVYVGLISDGTGSAYVSSNGASQAVTFLSFFQGATQISQQEIYTQTGMTIDVPASSFTHVDTPAAGTYTYTVQLNCSSSMTAFVHNAKLIAYEL